MWLPRTKTQEYSEQYLIVGFTKTLLQNRTFISPFINYKAYNPWKVYTNSDPWIITVDTNRQIFKLPTYGLLSVGWRFCLDLNNVLYCAVAYKSD